MFFMNRICRARGVRWDVEIYVHRGEADAQRRGRSLGVHESHLHTDLGAFHWLMQSTPRHMCRYVCCSYRLIWHRYVPIRMVA